MPSERLQRQIDGLLDEAEAAAAKRDWPSVRGLARRVLAIDSENEDARGFLSMADADAGDGSSTGVAEATPALAQSLPLPTSFASGRYQVRSFLGEGGRKRVYLAHDTRLDRDVALAVIKTEGLDDAGLARVHNEAQAMARLGDHPNVVTVHDVGDEGSQPYIVSQYMAGGSAEDLVAKADEHRLPLDQTLRLAEQVCRALEHAHRLGIVHRDLKPGNVWLTADGTAKLGDFGLAVALDRSRLTMEGMMLGTVAYMPPEQALGGDSTPKADLYSLGCMLYELVTGRPPFIGDDPTAIISQHINQPPVAPSWLSDRCPPDLEELICRLLAKAPDDRPASAAEVLGLLAHIDPAAKPVTHSGETENPLDRLARGVFVGRKAELEKLRQAFDEAHAGRGSLIMLVGEPGIGKTRTSQELETHARMKGALTLWGRSHESSGAPPYWPWVQVGRAWAGAGNDPTSLATDLTSEAGELVRLFPELGAIPDFPQPEEIRDPESAQFRLFDAYTSFIRSVSRRQPVLITLDDLHWADKPTLLLLQHLARELSRMRVLVLANYRDTDLSRTHPLSEALAGLNRDPGFTRVVLRSLSRAEVGAYIRATANVEAKRELVDRVFEETEGNPFFLSEVVNLMAQEGTLSRDSVSDIRIPDGVKEALGRRLDRLSEEANAFLQVMAVVGREFTFEMLQLLHEREDEALVRLIEESIKGRVIEEMEQAGRYRFTHALMQETLLGELTTTRKVRLHAQVGEALEKRWGARADQYASRLAPHFLEAATLNAGLAKKAVHYSKLAAEQAEAQTAWDEAARHYEACLSLVTAEGASEKSLEADEAALLKSLGRCQVNAGVFRPAWRSLMRAITLCRERGDWSGAAEAALLSERVPAPGPRHVEVVTAALDAPGERDPHAEALLYASRANHGVFSLERDQDIAQAALLADAHGFTDVSAALLHVRAVLAAERGEPEHAQRLRREAAGLFRSIGDHSRAAGEEFDRALALLFLGCLDEGEEAFAASLKLATETHNRYVVWNNLGFAAVIAFLRCDFDQARDMVTEATGSFLRQNMLTCIAELKGEFGGIDDILPPVEMTGGLAWMRLEVHGTRARVLWEAGEAERARAEYEAWSEAAREAREGPGGIVNVEAIGHCLAAIGEEEIIRRVYESGTSRPQVHFGYFGSMDCFRGQLALRLGLVDEAERWFQAGVEVCERERCPVEVGRNLQGLAEVAKRRGNRGEALACLDRAAGLFQKHGARLYLDQIVAKKVELQGIGSHDSRESIDAVTAAVQAEKPDISVHAAPDGTVTILFSDIEGHTEIVERLGDQAWLALLQKHNALIREQIKAHGGFEVKTIGDGFMVVFQSARGALLCAIAMQKAIADHSAAHSDEAMGIRIGLHAGEAVRDRDDFYGRNVIFASRVASQAVGGQILVSSLLKNLTESSGEFRFDDGREIELKGLSGVHRVFEVGWT